MAILGTRSGPGTHWVALFGAILAGWLALYAMAIPDDLREMSRLYGAEFWIALCTITPDMAGYGRVVLMWLLMSTAMMLPTALPAFATFDDLRNQVEDARFGLLVFGFLAVWGGFALVAAALQMALLRFDLISAFGDSRSVWLSTVLLGAAGLYQFSALKEACLSKCRAPLAFFIQHWGETPWRMGLRLGAACLGCCWALMLLAFVGGMMSLAFMGLATLIMTMEKLPDLGRWLSRPLGYALIGGAAWTMVAGL
ncbi:MAG: DUF2182 domain-containing protein [Pseudomonadota bacterium]